MSEFKWFWGEGRDPEVYINGCATREETIAEAERSTTGGFSIIYAAYTKPNFEFLDADNVLEQYDEANEECWGEYGSDIPKMPNTAARELEVALAKVFEAWATKHGLVGNVSMFGETCQEEYFPSKTQEQDA